MTALSLFDRPTPHGASPEAMARNERLLREMHQWRKALHAATQARSEGAKMRRYAHTATLTGDLLYLAECQAEAEKHYQHAEALEGEAQRVFMAIAQRCAL